MILKSCQRAPPFSPTTTPLAINPQKRIKTDGVIDHSTKSRFVFDKCNGRTRFASKCLRVINGSYVKKNSSLESLSVELVLHPTPYLEPFLRSFILGVSIGALSEMVHYGCCILWNGYSWPGYSIHPNLIFDHFSALYSWLLFYLMEAKAIDIILKKSHGNDSVRIAKKLDRFVTFPRRLLPWRMFWIKKVLINLGWFTGVHPEGQVVNNIVPFDKVHKNSKKKIQETREKLVDMERKGSPSKREEEIILREKYLKNFWYAAALSNQLLEKPLGVKILGMRLVLFRDSDGVAHALSDVCPHRGAPLHDGWTTQIDSNKCIVCPYHGWAFDDSGILRDVPAAVTSGEVPRKQMLDRYLIEEKGGFIWFFNGSKDLPATERPPIPYIPELDDAKWKPAYGSIDFNSPHWGVFENAIDMAHIHYLHAGTFGNQNQPEIKNMRCQTDTFYVSGKFSLHNKPVNALWNFAKIPQVDVTAIAFLPSTSVISFTLGNGLSFITFVNTVPIDKNRSCNRFALVRRLDIKGAPAISRIFNSNLWDNIAVKAMLKILTEDKAMVESLTPQDLKTEISVKADMIQLAFRKLRNEYIKFGFGQN